MSMSYCRQDYIGKEIELYPNERFFKKGIIVDVDDLGWTIKITNSAAPLEYRIGEIRFISHAAGLVFRFLSTDENKGE